MSQDFHKKVGQAVQADTANIQDQSTTINAQSVQGDIAARDIHHHHHAEPEKLTISQRRKLNKLVKEMEGYGQSGIATWRLLHEILGVNSIEDIHKDLFEPTRVILDLMIEKADLQEHLQESVSDEALEEDVLNLQERVKESTAEIARLTLRNSSLTEQLERANATFRRVQEQYAKALDQVKLMSHQAPTLERAIAERNQHAATIHELKQQIQHLEAHLKRALRPPRSSRRKILAMSVMGIAAAVLAFVYVPRLHELWSPAQQIVKTSSHVDTHRHQIRKVVAASSRQHEAIQQTPRPDTLSELVQTLGNDGEKSTTETTPR